MLLLMRSLLAALAFWLWAGNAMAMYTAEPVELTPAERQYLTGHPVATIAMDMSCVPFIFTAADDDGQPQGIIRRLLDRVSGYTGLKIEYAPAKNYKEALELVRSGQTDMIFGVVQDRAMATANNLILTTPYITVNYSAITNTTGIDDLYEPRRNYRMAVVDKSYSAIEMQHKMPQYVFKKYSSNGECIAAVQRNEADIALVTTYSAEYYLKKPEYAAMSAVLLNDFSWKVCFGVNAASDPRLLEILNRGLSRLTEGDINQAVYGSILDATRDSVSFLMLVNQHPIQATKWAALLICAVGLIIYWSGNKQRRQLRSSEEKFRLATQYTDISFWTYDCAQKEIIQTDQSQKRHGLAMVITNIPEALIENGYIREDSAAEFRRLHQELDAGAKIAGGDIWTRKRDGSGWWCEHIDYTNVFDEAGRPVRAYAVGRDVTSHKYVEQRYYEIMSMRGIFDKTAIGSFHFNLTRNTCGQGQAVNDHLMKMQESGTVDGFFAYIYSQHTDMESLEQYKKVFNRESLLQNFARGETKLSVVHRYLIDGYNAAWIETTILMMQNPKTDDVEALLYANNIDDIKTMQAVVDKIVQTEYDFLAVIDAQTQRMDICATKHDANYLPAPGTRYDDNFYLIAKNMIVEGEYEEACRKMTFANIIAELARRGYFVCNFSVNMPDGAVRRKQWKIFYLDKEKTRLFISRSDVTELYETEQQKQRRLAMALAMAEQASAAKSEFLSRMSHEIRTPMNAIMGLAAVAASDVGDKELVLDCLQKSQAASKYLLSLLNDILDMARIESGKVVLNEQVFNCTELISNINTIVEVQATIAGVEYSARQDGESRSGCYKADLIRVQQILINIISNAIKFTPAGGKVSLSIRQLRRQGGNAVLEFTVSDTGIGMSEAFLQDIFKPFVQEKELSSATFGGSGLGLAIAKNLATLMNGDITVQSSEGIGSTFTVVITVKTVDAVLAAQQTVDVAAGGYTDNFTGKRILLVEDHPLNVMVAIRLLQSKHCEVVTAENGQRGVEIFDASESGYFDAILMDIHMPVMDGLTAAGEIRALPRSDAATVPIIAMTANAFDDDITKTKAAGMDAHLAKPIDPQLLYSTLQKFLA